MAFELLDPSDPYSQIEIRWVSGGTELIPEAGYFVFDFRHGFRMVQRGPYPTHRAAFKAAKAAYENDVTTTREAPPFRRKKSKR